MAKDASYIEGRLKTQDPKFIIIIYIPSELPWVAIRLLWGCMIDSVILSTPLFTFQHSGRKNTYRCPFLGLGIRLGFRVSERIQSTITQD